MALHVPGVLTSSMPAMVSPRKTSSDNNRSRGAVLDRGAVCARGGDGGELTGGIWGY